MQVLLTRPFSEGKRLAALLQNRGHQAVLSPVMKVCFLDGPPLAVEGIQAILLTSANGACALARRTSVRDVPIFAVGPQTSEAARAGGFANVQDAGGDSAGLVEAVCRSARPQHGALLLAAGRERRGDVESKLAGAAFTVRVEELYDAVEIPRLSAAAAKALAEGGIDAVMLFSPRTAKLFVRQLQSATLEGECKRIIALCISDATAAALPPFQFASCHVARRPDREGMLQLLDEAAGQPVPLSRS